MCAPLLSTFHAGGGIMDKGASVVLIGPIADITDIPYYGTYATTKAALHPYAFTWIAELAQRGLRVNVVSPGPTDTVMMAATTDEVRAALVEQIPLGLMARMEEVAAALLLSGEASFIAGAELYVDGGMRHV
jgi:NAD(P)-dependent dehydrogenase (short-subunit alcohol dehydrogenase family)